MQDAEKDPEKEREELRRLSAQFHNNQLTAFIARDDFKAEGARLISEIAQSEDPQAEALNHLQEIFDWVEQYDLHVDDAPGLFDPLSQLLNCITDPIVRNPLLSQLELALRANLQNQVAKWNWLQLRRLTMDVDVWLKKQSESNVNSSYAPLTYPQAALYYQYEKIAVTKINRDKLARDRGLPSGQKLEAEYIKRESELARTAKAKYTVRDIEAVLPLLTDKAKTIAQKELNEARKNNLR